MLDGASQLRMANDYVEHEAGQQLARIDLSIYGLDALLKSAYRFTDRCFIHLQRTSPNVVEVRMRPKSTTDEPDTILREFFNDLLDQKLREVVAAETAGIRDLIMAHALSKTNLVRPDLETAEPAADPHHVANPDKPPRITA